MSLNWFRFGCFWLCEKSAFNDGAIKAMALTICTDERWISSRSTMWTNTNIEQVYPRIDEMLELKYLILTRRTHTNHIQIDCQNNKRPKFLVLLFNISMHTWDLMCCVRCYTVLCCCCACTLAIINTNLLYFLKLNFHFNQKNCFDVEPIWLKRSNIKHTFLPQIISCCCCCWLQRWVSHYSYIRTKVEFKVSEQNLSWIYS